MMYTLRLIKTLALSAILISGAAQAAGNWMDSVNDAVNGLNKSSNGNGTNNTMATTGNNTGSLAALSGLLNGGDQALSASTMPNAAGVLQYCVKNNLLSASGTAGLKDKLLGKLGITSTSNAKSEDYQEGLGGLLSTGKSGQVDLNSLSNSQLGQKVKIKACDVVLKQSKNFIS